tara:strand:+ start:118 stop:612 length:495 start_codon:yes stop_codon:yes gene_type:complete
MDKVKRTNLSVNERNIIELTLQGESQIAISRQLGIAPSTVFRTLRRPHIQNMITSSTQGFMSSIVQKMLTNYNKAQERIEREIDTMPIQHVIYYMNHVKQALQHIPIEAAKDQLKALREAKEGPIKIQVKYNDTDAMFDKAVKKALREYGIPEEEIEQQTFKYC